MKRFRIEITPSAEREITDAYLFAAARAPLTAARWYDRLMDSLNQLDIFATGHPLAPESRYAPEPVHQLLFGRRPHVWRILYVVRAEIVHIIHFRRAVRRPIRKGDLKLPDENEPVD